MIPRMPSRPLAMSALALLVAVACSNGGKSALPPVSPTPSVTTTTPSPTKTAKPSTKPTPKPTKTTAKPTPTTMPTSSNGIPPATGPAPKHFTPVDFSFLGHSVGWALGQHCPDTCKPIMARTTDSGRSWHESPAPKGATISGDEPNAIRHVRFGNLKNGWVFGPELHATHDGGKTWTKLNLAGEVYTLEEAKSTTWAIARDCSGGDCGFFLWVAPQDSDNFTLRRKLPYLGNGTLKLVRHEGSTAWLATNGPSKPRLWRTTNAGYDWTEVTDPCASFGDGSDQFLSRVDANRVWMLCAYDSGAGSQSKAVFHSTDGGRHWGSRSDLSRSGQATDFVALSASTALLSTSRGGLQRTTNGGITWNVVAKDCCDAGFGKIESINLVDVWAVGVGANAILYSPDRGARWSPYAFTA